MPSKITLSQKEKKDIAVSVMQQLQAMLDGNFEGAETLNIQIPKMKEIETTNKPKIIISTTAGLKMNELVRNCTKEVGWHGFVERIDDLTFKITDIVVYPQTVTGATVTTDEAEYALWLLDISTEDLKTMRFQGHSHVNMACNPSSTDLDLYNKYLASLNKNDFYIFFICNKRGELNALLYDLKTNTKYTKADLEIIKETDMTDWYETVKENIKEPKPIVRSIPQTNVGKTYSNYGGFGDMYYEQMRERNYTANSFDDSWDNRVAKAGKKEAKTNSKNSKK